MMRSKTYSQKPAEVSRQWYIIDAKDKVLGRLATTVAAHLSGKQKVSYTPHVDGGDYVIVINAKAVKVTGRKEDQKMYWRHSGYPGSIKSRSLSEVRERKPEFIIEHAVKGMLPKNKLTALQMKRLKVYSDATHNHEAQQPKEVGV